MGNGTISTECDFNYIFFTYFSVGHFRKLLIYDLLSG